MSFVDLLKLLGLLSVVAFFGSLIAVPLVIGRMKPDYFLTHWQQVETRHRRHPALALIISALRNCVGFVLVVAGVAMLVLPGQGLLTILIGICVMDFPGKRHLLDRLWQIPQVEQALNWIRRKEGKEEFVFPEKKG
jgi:archaellum biogenesis protein FlaJ (TadC family)